MIRVLLDSTALARGPSGTATYLEGLIEALEASGEVRLTLASAAPRIRGRTGGGRRGLGGSARSARNAAAERRWLRRGLPRRAAEADVQVIHHPLPARAPGWRGAQAVTVHDLAFERLPWAFDPLWRVPARISHRRAARGADAVVCVSETTARDARALWGVREERIVVAHHGVRTMTGARLPSRLHGRAFALYVGDDEPRKNLDALLTAWSSLPELHGELSLVVAGRAGRDPRLAGGDGVEPVADPSAEELAALYAGASLLVHPSLHEGFGLTPLEAMSHGTAVLVARSAGLVEVCAEAASYFDPRNPDALARELARLWSDSAERERLARAGAERAGEFTWARSAEQHLKAYEMAIRAKQR